MHTPQEPVPLQIFRAEFHIHTVLSPCAAVEMIPPLIIEEAQQKGIDILAVTDHNATANIEAVMQAAAGSGITVLAGIELHTREEVHVLCIFPGLAEAESFQRIIDERLHPGKNRAEVWGPQYIVDSTGAFIRHEERVLSLATSLIIAEAAQIVHQLQGLFIPAHIQRSMYGILPALGFLPPDVYFNALELQAHVNVGEILENHPSVRGFPILHNSDAHYLADIRGENRLLMANPGLGEIRLALEQRQGRMLLSQKS